MKASSVIFVSKEGIATFWAFLAGTAVLGSGLYVQNQTVKAGLRPQFIIMTNPDVIAADPGMDPAEEGDVTTEQTRLMMDSIFNRSSNGLDAAERCQKLLSPAAWEAVQTDVVNKQNEAFKSGRMHQKVEVERIDLHKLVTGHGDATVASVQGQLIRTGVLEDKLFNEVWNVRAQIVWKRNDSLRTSGRQPFICDGFTCREVPVASTIRRTLLEDADTAPKAADTTPGAAPN